MNFGGVIHLNKSGVCVFCGVLFIVFVYLYTGAFKDRNVAKQKINLKQLLRAVIKAAQNGGVEVVRSKDNLNIKSKGLTKEGMQDSVTTADYLSHCAMLRTLKHAYPTLNIVSEESKTECDQSQKIDYSDITDSVPDLKDYWVNMADITVWVDPLDATHEYTESLYEYVTTMVCVAVDGNPVIGVIHKPFLTDKLKTSWAWVGNAKSPNLHFTKKNNETLKIIISRSHSGEIKKMLKNNIEKYDLIEAAGAGYKSLEVANGRVDAYLHITAIKKWDVCAGNAIINAMNGKMTTKFNKLIDYEDVTNVENSDGLITTVLNHDLFIGKL